MAALVCGGRISVGRKDDGGSGGAGTEATSVMYAPPQLALNPQGAQAQECTLVHDPPAPWDQVHTIKDVVPTPTPIGQPPRKDPETGYSKIVPQSGRKYR
ncbi:hypothetical protein Tco_0872384 [Tanacetum coccineum]